MPFKNQDNTSEKELLYALKNGDVVAFDKLFAAYGKRLYHFCYSDTPEFYST